MSDKLLDAIINTVNVAVQQVEKDEKSSDKLVQKIKTYMSDILNENKQLRKQNNIIHEIVSEGLSDLIFHGDGNTPEKMKMKIFSIMKEINPHEYNKDCDCWWQCDIYSKKQI